MQFRTPNRRTFLRDAGCGFGSLALAAMLADEGLLASEVDPLAPEHPPIGKSAIDEHQAATRVGFDHHAAGFTLERGVDRGVEQRVDHRQRQVERPVGAGVVDELDPRRIGPDGGGCGGGTATGGGEWEQEQQGRTHEILEVGYGG